MPAHGAWNPIQVIPVPRKVTSANCPSPKPTAAVPPLHGREVLPMFHAPEYAIAVLPSSIRTLLPAPLATVTETVADVVMLPAPSRARAVSACDPLAAVVVSHAAEYGALVS